VNTEGEAPPGTGEPDEGAAPAPGVQPEPRLPGRASPGSDPAGSAGPPPPAEEPAPEVLPPPPPPFEPRLPAPPPPGSRVAAGEQPTPAARPLRTPPPNYLPPPSPRPRTPVMAPIEPLSPEPSGNPPWIWVAVGLASLLVLVVVLVLVLRSQSTGPLVVGTDVALDATQQTSGDCVTTVHFTAHGSLSGTGTIRYRFDRSDGQSTGNTQLSVDGNSGFELTEDWRFVGVHNGGGTMVFHIVSPTTREVRRDVTVRCP
jgi:hypothetical protein